MLEFCVLCLCGGLGAVVRHALDTVIHRRWHHSFPLGTLVINVIAASCAGLAAGAYAAWSLPHGAYLLFVTGFLGGLSTFSSATNQTVSLARQGRMPLSILYAVSTMTVPLGCAALSWTLMTMGR